MRIILIAFSILFMGISSASAASPNGIWLANNGKAQVKVSKCGSGLCARIIRLTQPNDQNGRPFRDQNNPNPQLRSRKVVGISLFQRMKPTSQNAWSGRLYSPEKGGTYNGQVIQISRNILKVKGCVGMFCQSYMWKRIK